MELSEREKIAHVYRRFGLGATPELVTEGAKRGLEATIERLINYEKVDEGFDIAPWEFCFETGRPEPYLDAYRSASYWCARLLMTQRPLQEKLTVFWHDHFAISAAKVEFGPLMVDYLETLRSNASGNFKKLLLEVSQEPAMLLWLDGLANIKGTPNENFAREVMELFTIGIGNYSEKDVREAARAFTGWGARFLIYEQGAENLVANVAKSMQTGAPMVAYSYSPELNDSGPKEILGSKKAWTGEQVLNMLADRPETATHLAKKLWSFFAYPNPEQEVIRRIAHVLTENQMEIKPALFAIARSPEFWNSRCIRQQVKSPLDFVVTLLRQLGVGEFLTAIRRANPAASPITPVAKELRDLGGLCFGLMSQQGMSPLFPPDVAGWEWGDAWITSAVMTQRMQLGPLAMGVGNADKGGAAALLVRVLAQGTPKNAEEVVQSILSVLDAEMSTDQVQILVASCQKYGGAPRLKSAEAASPMFGELLKLIFASPSFQMA